MRQILGAPGTPIQAFDQDAWAAAGHYEKRDARKSLEQFRVLREANLALLKSLTPEQWKHHGMHAERGVETIEHIVRMMAGHDLNHLAQVERIVAAKKELRVESSGVESSDAMKELLVVDLGLVEYGAAWELQRRVAAARKAGAIPDVLLLCEHPHVITLGRSGKISNLRAPNEMLRRMGVSFFETNRGGDITYHGPGQLVGYPILNLAEIRRDVGWYVRSLEEAMIRATAEFGVASRRVPGRTGVWVDVPAGPADERMMQEVRK